jgi:hypothetical protein
MGVVTATTEHTYTITTVGTWTQKSTYFPIKLLPKPLAEYVFDFINRGERCNFRHVCHQFESYFSLSHQKFVKGIYEGSIRVDCSIKRLVRKLLFKTPEKAVAMSPKYCFPENSQMVLCTGKWVDVSQVELDLSEIFTDRLQGDLFQYHRASLISRAMEAIGDKGDTCNLPICVEWNRPADFNAQDRIVDKSDESLSEIESMIQKKLDAHFSTIHFVVRDYYQVFLISLRVMNKQAVMTIFDSTGLPCGEEYLTTLVERVKSLLPDSLPLVDESPHVRCLLRQEAPHLNGYCILYTALLLTHKKDTDVLDFPLNSTLFDNAYHNLDFCADLVVRTLLHCWLIESENLWEEYLVGYFNQERLDKSAALMSDGIFIKLPKQFHKIVAQLKQRV